MTRFVFQQVHKIIAMFDAVGRIRQRRQAGNARSSLLRLSCPIPSLRFKTYIWLIRSLYRMSCIADATALNRVDISVNEGESELWESGGS